MRSLALAVLLFGCTGDTGPEGPPGNPGEPGSNDPTLSAISPRHAFPARTIDVVISGDDTLFDTTTTVDFGAGITVDKLTVVSPTQLAARITIAETATLGTRDVTVTTGDALVATMGFEVQPSLLLSIQGGPLLAGDIAVVQAASVDDRELSSTGTIDQLDETVLLNAQGGGTPVIGPQVLLAIVGPKASGPQQLIWRSGGLGGRTYVSDTTALAVTARAPTPLTLATATSVMFDTRSKLYSVAGPSLGIVTGFLQNIGSALQPRLMVLPGTGVLAPLDFSFGNRNTFAAVVRTGALSLDVVVTSGDVTGTDAAHSLQLGVIHTPVGALTAESGTAHGIATPQLMTSPAILDGTLGATDVDAYSVTVPTNGFLEVSFTSSASNVLVTLQSPTATILNRASAPGSFSFIVPNTGAPGLYKVAFEPQGAATMYTTSFRVF